jgi:hypothetical protein
MHAIVFINVYRKKKERRNIVIKRIDALNSLLFFFFVTVTLAAVAAASSLSIDKQMKVNNTIMGNDTAHCDMVLIVILFFLSHCCFLLPELFHYYV